MLCCACSVSRNSFTVAVRLEFVLNANEPPLSGALQTRTSSLKADVNFVNVRTRRKYSADRVSGLATSITSYVKRMRCIRDSDSGTCVATITIFGPIRLENLNMCLVIMTYLI